MPRSNASGIKTINLRVYSIPKSSVIASEVAISSNPTHTFYVFTDEDKPPLSIDNITTDYEAASNNPTSVLHYMLGQTTNFANILRDLKK